MLLVRQKYNNRHTGRESRRVLGKAGIQNILKLGFGLPN
jgi:hypothetical protein